MTTLQRCSFIMLLTLSFVTSIVGTPVLHDDLQCMEVNNPNNVAFETLQAYKANRISFDPMKSDYAGNYVEILEKLPQLTRDMFLTYDSNFIIKLALSKREVSSIEAGAFLGLNCLHYLRLRSNKIDRISSEMFEGLGNLLEINLENNHVTDIPQNVFRHLTSLKTLDLSNNKLSNIDSSPFKHLPTLANLDLSYNNLDSIPNGALSELSRLLKLDLSYNKLHDVPVESLEHLDTLKSFILTGNLLTTFNLESTYEYKALVYLYLDSNRFKQLNIQHIRKRFPKLLLLELQDNVWNCDDVYGVIAILNKTKLTYHHQNSTQTNVNGLDCIDYSASTTSVQTSTTTTELPHYPSALTYEISSDVTDSSAERSHHEYLVSENNELYETIDSIKSITVCILVLIILLIAFDFMVRGGILEKIIRVLGCRDYSMLNRDNAEQIRLLNTRSGL